MSETTTSTETKTIPATVDHSKDIAELKAQGVSLLARLEKLAPADVKTTTADPTLLDKARSQREADDKRTGDTKALEAALKFDIGAEQFLKTNESLLPKDITDLFEQSKKETYDSAVEKVSALKAGMIQSFFSVQANLDLLTPGLKTHLDDYLKLTKTGKQERAQSVYDSIFEPAFEMLKRIKKAEALNKGFGTEGDADTAYKNKMIALSKKHYLGEK